MDQDNDLPGEKFIIDIEERPNEEALAGEDQIVTRELEIPVSDQTRKTSTEKKEEINMICEAPLSDVTFGAASSGVNMPTEKEGNDELGDIKAILLPKITCLSNSYSFALEYSSDIVLLFHKFKEFLFNKITYTLNDNKYFLTFFREVTLTYAKFSSEIVKANSFINGDRVSEKMLHDNMSTILEATHENISKNFSNLSSALQSNIISKGPFTRIKEVYSRLSDYMKDFSKRISKLERRRIKLQKIFNSKYQKIFDEFKKNYNDPGPALTQLLEVNDFILIEMDLMTVINKMYAKIGLFLSEAKGIMGNMRDLIFEFIQMVREAICIYLDETKKIFKDDLTLKLDDIVKYYDTLSKDSLEVNLSVAKVLSSPEMIVSFNELFSNLQKTIVKYNIVKESSVFIDDHFTAEEYQTMDEFMEFLISLNPKPSSMAYEGLVQFEIELKRDPGIFKNWKGCYMIISKQNNVLIFDESISFDKCLHMLNLNRIKYKKKGDKKFPFRFEISETKKAKFFSSSVSCLLDGVTQENFDLATRWFQLSKQQREKEVLSSKEDGSAEKDLNNPKK